MYTTAAPNPRFRVLERHVIGRPTLQGVEPITAPAMLGLLDQMFFHQAMATHRTPPVLSLTTLTQSVQSESTFPSGSLHFNRLLTVLLILKMKRNLKKDLLVTQRSYFYKYKFGENVNEGGFYFYIDKTQLNTGIAEVCNILHVPRCATGIIPDSSGNFYGQFRIKFLPQQADPGRFTLYGHVSPMFCNMLAFLFYLPRANT